MASYSHYDDFDARLRNLPTRMSRPTCWRLKDQIVNTRYIHDFNSDNSFGQPDADWLVQWIRGYKQPNTSTQKTWKLGPIDHSTPALLVPPGYPVVVLRQPGNQSGTGEIQGVQGQPGGSRLGHFRRLTRRNAPRLRRREIPFRRQFGNSRNKREQGLFPVGRKTNPASGLLRQLCRQLSQLRHR